MEATNVMIMQPAPIHMENISVLVILGTLGMEPTAQVHFFFRFGTENKQSFLFVFCLTLPEYAGKLFFEFISKVFHLQLKFLDFVILGFDSITLVYFIRCFYSLGSFSASKIGSFVWL